MKTFYQPLLLCVLLFVAKQNSFAQCGDYLAQNTSSVWKGTTASTVTFAYDGLVTQSTNVTYNNGVNNFRINNGGADQRLARGDDFSTGYTITFSPAVRASEIGFYIEDLDALSQVSPPTSPTTTFTFAVNGVATPNDFAATNISQPVQMNYTPSTGIISTAGAFDNQGICIIGTSNKLVTSITITSSGGISANDLIAYSFFASMCTILPVKFISFNGVENNGAVNLNWLAANEINVKSYSIERSFNGTDFSSIGSTSYTNINNGLNNSYIFSDNSTSLNNTVVYYRIKENDINGNFYYSSIIAVNLKSSKNELLIYPNPINENLFVTLLNNKSEQAIIIVADATGRNVITQKMELVNGKNFFTVAEVNKLAKGTYVLYIKKSGGIVTQQFAKQ